MADPRNPYMPTGLDRLSTMLMALGAGVSGAESRGQSGWAGIGPAAAMYGQANQQANQQAMQYGMWQQQREEQKAHQAVQEENLRSQIDERKRAAGLEEKLMGMVPGLMQPQGGVPGMGVPPSAPTMGPGPELLKEGPQKVAYMTEKHGLPPVASAGLVGNLYQESKFNPTVVGDNGTAYGLAQWRGDRQTALKAFAQSQGRQPSDPMVQLDFIAHEGKNGDMGAQRAWAMLQTAKSPQDATTALMHYFRPAGYTPNNPTGGHAFNNRVQYAQALMPGAGGGASPPNAQGQGDASGGGSMPPGQGPQMPGPPPDPTRYAPLAMSPRLGPVGTILRERDKSQYEHGWKTYDATRDQGNKDRDYNFQVKKADSEGQFVRGEDGKEVWVPQAELRGKTRADKPPEPGTEPGDVRILTAGNPASPDYAAAFNRLKGKLIDGPNGIKYAPDMSAYAAPTFRAETAAPAGEGPGGLAQVGGTSTPKEMSDLRTARAEAETMVKALEDFRGEFIKAKDSGDRWKSVAGVTTPVNTAYNAAALLAKGEQLFNLGVLNGPDLEIIRRTLPDPSTIRGSMTNPKDMGVAVDKVISIITSKLQAREKQLGVAPSAQAAGPDKAALAAPIRIQLDGKRP